MGIDMDDIKIAAIPVNLVELIFPKAIPHLERVVEKAPNDVNIDTIKQALLSGSTMMVTISEGDQVIAVNILEATTYPTGHKVLYIPNTGGDRMDEWLDRFMEIAHAIAQDLGCDELRGMACRKGWLRALKEHDWYPIHEVIGCRVKQREVKEKTEVSS